MRRLTLVLLSLLATSIASSEEHGAAPDGDAALRMDPERAALAQAFDGALTCAALSAIKGDQAHKRGEPQAWQWSNRAFAFGMLAARFYGEARQQAISRDQLDEALNNYADLLIEMPDADRERFEINCAAKYADVDALCRENACPFTSGGEPRAAPSGP